MTPSLSLILPAAGVIAVAAEVRSFGVQNVETGGFLLSSLGSTEVTTVAVAATSGIVRRSNQLQISARALARLFDYADDHDMYAPVQFHSHQQGAFMSYTDKTYGLRVEGLICTVIPTFARPPADPAAWGWWSFHETDWLTCIPAQVVPGPVRLIRFDEQGIEEVRDEA